MAFIGFFLVAGASAVYLWNGSRAADRLAEAAAEVGVLFCSLVLVTGPIWARPIWGVWWTWDPRLTMTVILWAIYASYLMLRAFGGEDEAVNRYAAVLGIIGVLDIPIIMVSVRLLRGMHPAVIARNEGGSGLVDPWMRIALLVSAVALILVLLFQIGVFDAVLPGSHPAAPPTSGAGETTEPASLAVDRSHPYADSPASLRAFLYCSRCQGVSSFNFF